MRRRNIINRRNGDRIRDRIREYDVIGRKVNIRGGGGVEGGGGGGRKNIKKVGVFEMRRFPISKSNKDSRTNINEIMFFRTSSKFATNMTD